MPASLLPVYDKKRLMIATALATEPLVLLLDEPFGGLNPGEIDATMGLLRRVGETGVAIVCIEHVMRALVALADRVLVMHHGAELFIGTPAEMMRDQRVIEVYLGSQRAGADVSAALYVSGLTAGYDRTVVVRDLTLSVDAGKTAVVIGPNGHGKTTMLLAISGLIKPWRARSSSTASGSTAGSAESIAGSGIVHILQGDGLFSDMTVEENLLMGAFLPGSWRGRRETLKRVYGDLPVVEAKRDQKARTLSGGERRLVGLGRGMMRPARLMLIDEPSLGLAPVAIEAVYAAIAKLRASRVPP